MTLSDEDVKYLSQDDGRDLYRWLMGWDGNTAERGES